MGAVGADNLRLTSLMVLLLALPCSTAAGCTSSHDHTTGVVALTVTTRPTPQFQVPHYRTSGTYPQVGGGNVDLRRVNTALTGVVLAEQRRYAPLARRQEKRAPDPIHLGYTGTFATSVVRGLISASSGVVSALIPLDEIYPGGHVETYWLSATLRVPSGSAVALSALFANPARALPILAREARRRLVSSNGCVRDSLATEQSYANGFAPTAENFAHFALTPGGLAVGFPPEQVASAVCNEVKVRVPYTALSSYWSTLGRKLVSAVRRPS
jgi:hypothetical protein